MPTYSGLKADLKAKGRKLQEKRADNIRQKQEVIREKKRAGSKAFCFGNGK